MPSLIALVSAIYPPPFSPMSAGSLLQRLTRYRFHLSHRREKTCFLTLLFLNFSQYRNLDPFSNTFGADYQAVLADYVRLNVIAAAPLEEPAHLLVQ